MDSKTLSQLKKDSDYIENDALKEMKALVFLILLFYDHL